MENHSQNAPLVNFNIGTSFVRIGALIADTLIVKGHICIHLQTRALAFWLERILGVHRINKNGLNNLKIFDSITYVFKKS